MLWDSKGKKKFYMDLGRFLKSSEGCFFVFNEKGNYDIVCNKLKQLRLFAASGRNTCLFTSDVANVIDYMNRYRVSCHDMLIMLLKIYFLGRLFLACMM